MGSAAQSTNRLLRLTSRRRAAELAWRRRISVLTTAALTALAVLLLSFAPPWRLVEARAFDYFSTIAPPPRPENGPVIVAIDEPSMAEIGAQWPWPRELHARLIDALRKAGARAIGLDIIFAEKSSPVSDDALKAALGPDIVLAGDEAVLETPQASQLVRIEPLAYFQATGARTGIASIALDGDAVLRRLPRYKDGFAAVLLERIGKPAPLQPDGLIQTFGPPRSYPTYSYYQALDPDGFLPKGVFEGRIVIVGLSMQSAPKIDAGGADAHATSATVRSDQLVSGAEIQATIFDNLADRLFIASAPPWLKSASVLLATILAAAMVWRGTNVRTLMISAAAIAVTALGCWALLRFGRTFVPPVTPSLAFIMVAALQGGRDYAAERRLRRDITRAFAQYLSPVLVERLANRPEQLRLGGEKRTLTILFCDVRGFTTLSENMKDRPEELTRLVNRLLNPLSHAVIESGGTIDKYMGDCIMAFWNAPLEDADHAVHAVDAAMKMHSALDDLNDALKEESEGTLPTLRVGIGINTGECIVGNMGSEMRFDYSAIGDAVNLASRLEGQTKSYGVPLLLGETTTALVKDRYHTIELDRIAVRGRTGFTAISTVIRDPGAEVRALHSGMLDEFYAGTLKKGDPRLSELSRVIPELSAYYAGLARRLGSRRDA